MSAAEADVAGLPTDPGSRLRRQREQAGLTAQQVADQLNLDAVVVDALDRNDYSTLGAPVFVRGHIRRYATLVGADAAEVLAAYDRSRSGPGQPTLIPRSREEMQPMRTRQRQRPRTARYVAGAVVLLLAGGVVAWIATQGLRWPWSGDSSAVASPVLPMSTLAPAGDAVTTTVAPAATAAAPAARVSVLFRFSGDSWIEVYDATGQTVLYDLGKSGTQRPVSGAAPLNVTLGNAPAVALDVNGRRATLPAAEAGGTVAHFEVGADGTTRKLVGDRT